MGKRNNELKVDRYKEKIEVKKPRREFKIEIVKIGKLDENTGHEGNCGPSYGAD